MKHFFFVCMIIFSVLMSSALNAYAQVLDPEEGARDFQFLEDPRRYVPELYVHSIVLDQAAYATGDTVFGTFTISNNKDVVATDVTYRVQLVGNFTEAGFPQTIFNDVVVDDTFTIDAFGNKKLSFSYELPSAVPSRDMGIQIQTYIGDDRPTARRAIQFAITGGVTNYLQHIAQVQISGEPYGLREGPTVYRGEQIHFAISLKNNGPAVTLTPTVTVYKRLQTGELLDSFTGDTIRVASSRTSEQRMELPVFEYEPGIYTAVIVYRDDEGVIRSGPHEARYIIEGMGPHIDFVTTDKLTVSRGDLFSIFVQYADIPVDIRFLNEEQFRAQQKNPLTAVVEVTDAYGNRVDTQRVVFEPGRYVASVSFLAPYDMTGMHVEVQLVETETVIDSVKKTFTQDGRIDAVVPAENATSKISWYLIGVGSVAIFVLIGFIIWLMRRKRKLALLICLVAVFGTPSLTYGFGGITYVNSGGVHPIYIPTTFQINSPLPRTIKKYRPGESIYVQMDMWSVSCNNTPKDISVRVSDPLSAEALVSYGVWKQLGAQTSSGSHAAYNAYQNGFIGPLTVPEEPGIYRIHFHIRNMVQWGTGNLHNNWFKGYIEIEVADL